MAPGLLNKPQRQSQKLPVIAYLWKSILFQRHPVCQDQSMTAFCRCGVRTPTLGVTNAQAFHALCSTRRSKEMHIVAFSKPLQQNTTCVKFRLPIPKGLQAQATGTQGELVWSIKCPLVGVILGFQFGKKIALLRTHFSNLFSPVRSITTPLTNLTP